MMTLHILSKFGYTFYMVFRRSYMKDFNTYICESKANCQELFGMDPEEIPFLKVGVTAEQLRIKQQSYGQVLSIVQQFMQRLLHYMDGTPTLVITTDNYGYVLDIYGAPSIRKMVDALGITIGARFDEMDVGTNSVALALKHREPVEVIGNDHFHSCLSGIACYSAPFFYCESGGLAGTVSTMTMTDYASHFHLGLLSSAVDSIEREIQLQEQNHKLNLFNQVVINSTPLGIVMTDKNGDILEFNPGAEAITGVKKERVLGKAIKHLSVIEEYVKNVLQDGRKVENIEISYFLKKINTTKTCLLDIVPLFDGFNQIIGAFAQFRDMTNYYELQEQVIQSEKLSAIGKLGAGLAHEIRNPLTSVIGLTQLYKENNEQEKYLDIITSELERMKSLVNQFVLLGKPTVIKRRNCNLHELVADTVELMNSNSNYQNIELHFDPSETEININIDESQIKQVLINFIKNAFEAMSGGGELGIKLLNNCANNEVQISIQDNGEGMTKKEVENLGTPFFTTKESGLGMGMPICFDIIKAHGGVIKVDSEKRKGTTIHLFLPLNNNPERRQAL